ncbi:MAG: YraN family protein [Verrucomicrobia bacterium]|nr:YraN family protein [Verrucomicrobiota bacterium]
MSWRSFVRFFGGRFGASRAPSSEPEHLRRGRLGEEAARHHLENLGFQFLAANHRWRRGELDLVFEFCGLLVFVEVKTREVGGLLRPAAAVNRRKRLRLTRAALDYLRVIGRPRVPFRFDIVEVLIKSDQVWEVRHLPDAFRMSKPYRYG